VEIEQQDQGAAHRQHAHRAGALIPNRRGNPASNTDRR
jgi:hypothetical protein